MSAARRMWRAARVPVAIAVTVLALGIVTALVRGGAEADSLDPQSPAPNGTRALAQLLEAEGVTVRRASDFGDAAAAAGATIVVTAPGIVGAQRLSDLAAAAETLVLVAPPDDMLDGLGVPLAAAEYERVRPRDPGCADLDAQAAGRAVTGGVSFAPPPEGISAAALCYDGTVVRAASEDGGSVIVFGAGDALTNQELAGEGNAALAMRLLGAHEELVWYLPVATDPALRGDEQSLIELIPAGWKYGTVQLVIAVALFALWRARRLGPVITEPLPVVVRAAETTEGRARLYQRTADLAHASAVLRGAARERLARALSIPGAAAAETGTPGDALAAAINHQTGIDLERLRAALGGPEPDTDRALVALARELDDIEARVAAARQ